MNQDVRLYGSKDVWNQNMQLGQKNLLRAVIDFWPEQVSSAIDVGCGDGKLTEIISQETGLDIVGFDSSAEALSRMNLETIQGDAATMPFGNAAFDLVLSTDTLEHIPDETYDQAWSELFRVAKKYVMVAVPFRENLLDSTAKCSKCSTQYHVNWHQRSYDIDSFSQKAPAGWYVQSIVVSGEPWPDMLPKETCLRRELFGEWSGWKMAICPECGSAGKDPDPVADLGTLVTGSLGQQIYASLTKNRIWRSHSEILVIFSKLAKNNSMVLCSPMKKYQSATLIEPSIENLKPHLISYPQVARSVKGVDGNGIIQFPIYADSEKIYIKRKAGNDEPLLARIQDGLGVMHSGLVMEANDLEATISLPRAPVSGQFGLLVYTEDLNSIESIKLGNGPEVCWLTHDKSKDVSYYNLNYKEQEIYVQVTSNDVWIDESLLEPVEFNQKLDIKDLFKRLCTLGVGFKSYLDRLIVNIQNLEAERNALNLRAKEADRLAVELQNLKANLKED